MTIMTIYHSKIQEVKERADIVRVANYFGIKSKQCCPFHNEKHASFSISKSKQIYKCFSCGKGGDVISFVSELLKINAYESAKQINSILNLNIDFGKKASSLEIEKWQEKQKLKKQFLDWENKTFQLLCDYWKILSDGLEKEIIDYFIDEVFIYGTNEDKLLFYKTQKKVVSRASEQLRRRLN